MKKCIKGICWKNEEEGEIHSLNYIFKETFIFGYTISFSVSRLLLSSSISSIYIDNILVLLLPPVILLISIDAAHIMGAKRRRIKLDNSTGGNIQWSLIGSFIVSCQYFTTPFFRGLSFRYLAGKNIGFR